MMQSNSVQDISVNEDEIDLKELFSDFFLSGIGLLFLDFWVLC